MIDHERSADITIGGEEYTLILTTKATKAIAARYGGLENLGNKLLKSENFEMALDEVVWLITLLANQSIMIYNLTHKDSPKELLTEDTVELLTVPSDLALYTSKYPFSGLLVCATCGSRLRRHVRTVGSGKRVPSWACCTRILHGRTVCDSHHIREDVLERTYLAAIQKMVDDAAEVIATVREGAMLAMEPENAAKLEAVDREILATQEQMLAMHKQFTAQRISAEAYNEAVRAASVKIQELEEQREELETVATRYAEVKVWLDAFEESTRTGQIMTATDAVIMKTLVEEILVDDYGFEVKFKCGASVEQEYLK